MFRFYFTIAFSLFAAAYFFTTYRIYMKNPDAYTELQKYNLVLFACRHIRRKGNIKLEYYGNDNLPEEGGYIMYSNHQGRYDAIGIVESHQKPCTYVIDYYRSQVLLLNQATDLLDGKRLDKSDMKGQVRIMQDISNEVKAGRRYLIFPEGGYDDIVTDNTVKEFMPGAFKAAIKAQSPIIPIALIDSYKVYLKNSLRRVRVQVHFLEPIPYEEYKGLNTHEISDLVKSKICDKIDEVLASA